ncbi:carboxymuconolactone decarboxylase family protein [Mucilaginibacter xinganensis]|uniref:Carboxymuconolactone decarboxylase family protein n=1 Tax=Mucilaginibacter xinganensis TaxID=1234841 RepID=A0A223NYD8_9SPHI|nr:carboxymuconolactone decarboxylase family protein [Mucilaginibacter xinganensis]ASU34899.1 Carboxymuconolactone decarboxylase family protein [Mucilaginibacter xinganensis]
MPHIAVEEHLPGITGLLEFRKDTAQPIRELTQILLRGTSTLTEGERELIATVVSNGNNCKFCTAAHTAAADLFLGESETAGMVKTDIAAAPVSEKMKTLLTIADSVRESGKLVTTTHIEKAKAEGATDLEIHDTVLIAALFCLYNRYVDGLGTALPADPGYFDVLAERLINNGYMRLPQGYDHLKK